MAHSVRMRYTEDRQFRLTVYPDGRWYLHRKHWLTEWNPPLFVMEGKVS